MNHDHRPPYEHDDALGLLVGALFMVLMAVLVVSFAPSQDEAAAAVNSEARP